MDATTALAIYRAEKDKALRERRVSHVQLMAEAQEAFRKMLADAQLARKGGRPKGSTNAVASVPVATATPPTPAAVPGKLVLKTAKSTPSKSVEKVTAIIGASEKPHKVAKAASATTAAKKSDKHASEKRRTASKPHAVGKPVRRASAPVARKGSAKKSAPRRKQAAARERTAKGRKR